MTVEGGFSLAIRWGAITKARLQHTYEVVPTVLYTKALVHWALCRCVHLHNSDHAPDDLHAPVCVRLYFTWSITKYCLQHTYYLIAFRCITFPALVDLCGCCSVPSPASSWVSVPKWVQVIGDSSVACIQRENSSKTSHCCISSFPKVSSLLW